MYPTNICFKDKVILITGSSRGIGHHLARAFGGLQATIIVNFSKSKKEALATVEEIKRNGGKAMAIKANVSKSQDVEAMCRQIIEKYSRIDILINNAGGVFEDKDWTKHDSNNWNKTIDVNLTGVFNCIRAIAPIMINQESGKILNISSLRSILGATDIVAYAAAKAGVNNLTKSYAKILGPYINVNSLVLGRINSDASRTTDGGGVQKISTENLVKRLGEQNDVFNAVSFLISSGSDFITGQTLVVDGGAGLK